MNVIRITLIAAVYTATARLPTFVFEDQMHGDQQESNTGAMLLINSSFHIAFTKVMGIATPKYS